MRFCIERDRRATLSGGGGRVADSLNQGLWLEDPNGKVVVTRYLDHVACAAGRTIPECCESVSVVRHFQIPAVAGRSSVPVPICGELENGVPALMCVAFPKGVDPA